MVGQSHAGVRLKDQSCYTSPSNYIYPSRWSRDKKRGENTLRNLRRVIFISNDLIIFFYLCHVTDARGFTINIRDSGTVGKPRHKMRQRNRIRAVARYHILCHPCSRLHFRWLAWEV